MRSKNFKQLVVDTSVALAAGGREVTDSDVEAKDLVSINCTEFLETFRGECSHHVVMTLELFEEWKRRRSKFTVTWLRSMIARKRWDYVEPPVSQALRDKIEGTATSESEIEDMRKDFRLLEAARSTDQAIISLDETVRGLFARATQRVGEIRDIVWVNPNHTKAEEPLIWLKNGAPPEDHRKLRAWKTV